MACVGVGGWLGECVWVRVEEGMAERACLLVGWMFDHIIASSLFLKWWWVIRDLSFACFGNNECLVVCHCYRVTDDQVYLLVLNCRLSPRRKTERDVPETDGTGGRRRRMSLRWKAKTGGPSVLMPFHLGDIRLCHPFWPSQSRRRTSPRRMAPRRVTLRRMTPRRVALRRMSPRRMALRRMTLRRRSPRRMALRRMSPRRMALRRMPPRRRKSETDAPETDGAQTDAPETEVPETEEDRDGGRRGVRCVCFCLFALLKDCGRL